MSQSRLLAQKRFAPLFWTQFLGAFNDNVYKNALVILFSARLAREAAHTLVQVAGGVFILPYFLFSATAGQVADQREKSRLVRGVKLLERIIAASAVPVVPMALRGLWGSFFSRVEGAAMKHPFRRGVLSRIELVAGEPVPAAMVSAKGLEDRVRELRGDAR